MSRLVILLVLQLVALTLLSAQTANKNFPDLRGCWILDAEKSKNLSSAYQLIIKQDDEAITLVYKSTVDRLEESFTYNLDGTVSSKGSSTTFLKLIDNGKIAFHRDSKLGGKLSQVVVIELGKDGQTLTIDNVWTTENELIVFPGGKTYKHYFTKQR